MKQIPAVFGTALALTFFLLAHSHAQQRGRGRVRPPARPPPRVPRRKAAEGDRSRWWSASSAASLSCRSIGGRR